MFNKNDPLIASVQKVMQGNERARQIENKLCEELGIYSRKALPREHLANYDALLEQRINEALHPNQQKLDVHEPEKDKLTSQDFKMLRAKKTMKEEEQLDEISKKTLNKATSKAYSLAVKGRMRGEPEEYEKRMKQTSKFKRAADEKDEKENMSEEQLDELSSKTYKSAMMKAVQRHTNASTLMQKDKKEKAYAQAKKFQKAGIAKEKQEKMMKEEDTRSSDPDMSAPSRTPGYKDEIKAKSASTGPSSSDREALTNKIKSVMKEQQISEKELTDAEMAKREEIVKSMKKGAKGFKSRYGDRAKEVMYATATKQAKKLAEQPTLDSVMEEIRERLGEESFNEMMAEQQISELWDSLKAAGSAVYNAMANSQRPATVPDKPAAQVASDTTAARTAQKASTDVKAASAKGQGGMTGEYGAAAARSDAASAADRVKAAAARGQGDMSGQSGAGTNPVARSAAPKPAGLTAASALGDTSGSGKSVTSGAIGASLAAARSAAPARQAPAARPAAPAARPAAPAARPATPAPAAKPAFVEPASSSEGGESASSFFAADKARQSQRANMRESLEATIRNVIKG